MKTVEVDLGSRSYKIEIGSGILNKIGERMAELHLDGKVLVVTNTTVGPLYGDQLLDSLKNQGFQTSMLTLPDGEAYKDLTHAAKIFDAAAEAGLDRSGTILALGGGVIGDMAGFAASAYMRGTNFVQVPTTLLSQVDASVGGKVAVNHPRGKNLIGAFYQPRLVWEDVAVLNTLSAREILSGIAEIIKYGVIADRSLFEYLEEHVASLTTGDPQVLINIIERSCAIKAAVVADDEQEHGRRAILNFGHTIGHALEAATDYQSYRHGEAVAIGMVGALIIAEKLGLIGADEAERVEKLIADCGLPVRFSGLSWEKIWFHMQADKKAKKGHINFILPTDLGTVTMLDVAPDQIEQAVMSLLK